MDNADMAKDPRHSDSPSSPTTDKSTISTALDLSFPPEFAQMQGPLAPTKDGSYTPRERSSTSENDPSTNTTQYSPWMPDGDENYQLDAHVNPDANAQSRGCQVALEAETRDDLGETPEDGASEGLFGQWMKGVSKWSSALSGPSATESRGKNDKGSSVRSVSLSTSSTTTSSLKNTSPVSRRSIGGMVREEREREEKERLKQEQQKIDERKKYYLEFKE